MTSNTEPVVLRDDSAILWRRLFRLWVLMTMAWAFMGIWTTGLGCSLGTWSARWCVGPTSLSASEIASEMLGLPAAILVMGLLTRGMLLGTRALIASAVRSSRSR